MHGFCANYVHRRASACRHYGANTAMCTLNAVQIHAALRGLRTHTAHAAKSIYEYVLYMQTYKGCKSKQVHTVIHDNARRCSYRNSKTS